MNVIEKPMTVTLEPASEAEYRSLLNDYFTASERNSRASSILEKKQIMAVKEQMAQLCNRNKPKREMLKSILKEVREAKEKAVVVTKAPAVAAELADELAADGASYEALLLTAQLSVHEIARILDRFNKSPGSLVLTITDSVNTGLDLTAANHMIHYDYPARYADLLQRNHRILRQTSYHSQATFYYMATSGKIDEFDYMECMLEKTGIGDDRSTI